MTLTDRLFTGQRLDSSTGLYYYNARYYDPYLGRFIQPDTLVPNPLNPQAWNRFSYVYNNPTSYVDPGGHVAWVPILIFGGAFLLGAGAGGYYAYQQGYGFESWQLYAYAGMGGLAGVAGAATGMWIEAALLPVGATVWQASAAGAAGGFAAGVVEQSILEVGGAAILGTEVSGERILLAGVTGGVTGGLSAGASRWWRLRAAVGEAQPHLGGQELIDDIVQNELENVRLTLYPEYDPNLSSAGEALRNYPTRPGFTRIGPRAIQAGRRETLVTIVHEEMHHRIWARNWLPVEDYIERVAQRFARLKGY